jgi:hypothetical protein
VVEVEYTAVGVAQKEIKGQFQALYANLNQTSPTPVEDPEVATTTGNKGKCKLSITPDMITPALEGGTLHPELCATLWQDVVLQDRIEIDIGATSVFKHGKVVLKHKKLEAAPTLSLDSTGDLLTFKGTKPATSAGAAFVFQKNNAFEWTFVPLGPNGIQVPAPLKEKTPFDIYTNFTNDGKEGYGTFRVVRTTTPTPAGPPGSPPPAPPCPNPEERYRNFYKTDGRDDPKLYRISVDLFGDKAPRYWFQPDTRQIILPNRSVLLKVRYPRETKIDVEMGGERGLFEPGIRINLPTKPADGTPGAQAEAPSPCDPNPPSLDVVSEITFGPRRPGQADIEIKHKNKDGTEIATHTIELTVETTYLGAIRLGVGPVFKGAVDRSYSSVARPGSQQREIAATSSGNVDLELVLGFAPYLFDFIGGEGRGTVTHCKFCLAPYVGIGVLNQSTTSLEVLKSLHFGLEWEFSPSFSLAGTFVLRRVTRLAPGYQIGSPVDDEVPTVAEYGFGGGLVFNFSPEFFKFATQPTSGFFK